MSTIFLTRTWGIHQKSQLRILSRSAGCCVFKRKESRLNKIILDILPNRSLSSGASRTRGIDMCWFNCNAFSADNLYPRSYPP